MTRLAGVKAVSFDVDGTLTVARKLVTPDMLAMLKDLRKKVYIGFVGGSAELFPRPTPVGTGEEGLGGWLDIFAEPLMDILKPGGSRLFFNNVAPEDVAEIIDSYILNIILLSIVLDRRRACRICPHREMVSSISHL